MPANSTKPAPGNPRPAYIRHVSRYYAVAKDYRDGTYTLLIYRRSDDHEVWGDQPLPADRWTTIPTHATARLAGTAYRITGPWTEVDGTWRADAD
jgi:hypothetical protein